MSGSPKKATRNSPGATSTMSARALCTALPFITVTVAGPMLVSAGTKKFTWCGETYGNVFGPTHDANTHSLGLI